MHSTVEKTQNGLQSKLHQSGLFDDQWYSESYTWVVEQGGSCLDHYIKSGDKKDRLPNKYFMPQWYRDKYLRNSQVTGNSLLHYHEVGRFEGFSPSPYFDVVGYAAIIGQGVKPENALAHWIASDRKITPPKNDLLLLELDILKTGLFLSDWYKSEYMDEKESNALLPIEHYVLNGTSLGYRPNPYFDSEWYLNTNPHVLDSGEHPVVHYAMHGWRNGKVPSKRFQAQRYLVENTMLRSADRAEFEPLNHFLYSVDTTNNGRDMVPISGYTPRENKSTIEENLCFRDFLSEPGFRLLQYFTGNSAFDLEIRKSFSSDLEEILQCSELEWLREPESLELLAAMYHPLNEHGLYSVKVLNDFLKYVSEIHSNNSIPCGLFDPNLYRATTRSLLSDSACLREWITSANRIIPNSYFDGEVYKRNTGAKLTSEFSLFIDWLYEGMYNNIPNGNVIALNYIASRIQCIDGENIFASYLMARGFSFNRRYETLEQGREEELGAEIISEYYKNHSDENLRSRLISGSLYQQICAAAEYDSKIMERSLEIGISRPPFNTVLASVVRRVRLELPKNQYDTVIMIPHCRMSGATKIAGKFAEAIASIGIDDSILIVITDLDINIHPEWFPEDTDTYSLAKLLTGLEKAQKESVLYDLLCGVGAKRVMNVNSALGWDVYEVYGKRLATQCSLSAYFFCYDLNKDDVKVGYPSKYFVSSMAYLENIIFDSDYLREEVTAKNMIMCDEDCKKLTTFYTPVEINQRQTYQSKDDSEVKNKNIYWAGRLDRQKNFSLVIRIARLLPEIQFHCWGESVIGDYQLEEVPANITINPPYSDMGDLDLNKCDLWLYTSKWDGIPNLILEVGVSEVPLVSTAVWGTRDILNTSNSWLVDDVDNAESYCSEITGALTRPEERREKSKRLKQGIVERHSMENFANSVLEKFY